MKITDIPLATAVGQLDFWETFQQRQEMVQALVQNCSAPELIVICSIIVGECIDLMPEDAQQLFLKYFVQSVNAYNGAPASSLLGMLPEGSA